MVKPAIAYLSALLFSLFGLIYTSHAMAIECYTPSPNLTSLGDDYYALEKQKPLSDEINDQVNALFRAMAGKWKGDMQYLECRGPDRAPRIILRTALVTVKAKLNSELGLEMNADKYDFENRSKRPENLTLVGKTPTFDLKFISNGHVVFAERYRRLNQVGKEKPTKKSSEKSAESVKQKTSRITETIIEIETNGGSLDFARFYYTNGVYIGEEHWKMQPPSTALRI